MFVDVSNVELDDQILHLVSNALTKAFNEMNDSTEELGLGGMDQVTERNFHHNDAYINAMIMLWPYRKVTDASIICAASHGNIYFDVDLKRLNEHIDNDFLNDPHRCGVFYYGLTESFVMYT